MWRSALESGNYELLCSSSRDSRAVGRQTEHMDVDTPVQPRAADRYTCVHTPKVCNENSCFPMCVQATARE